MEVEESTARVWPTTTRLNDALLAWGTFQKFFKYSCLDVADTHLLQKLVIQNVLSTGALVDV